MNIKSVKNAQIKATSDNIVEGYASNFGNKDSHGDIIQKGAFSKTLKENKSRIKMLWQHNLQEPIGKPLEMFEDEKGLYTQTKISQTDIGKKVMILAKDGVINEMSIGYYPIKEKYEESAQANMIKEIKLLEYSVVTIASNEMATLTDVKHLFNQYQYSKGNIIDILADEIAKKLIREPSITHEDTEIDLILKEIQKIKGGN